MDDNQEWYASVIGELYTYAHGDNDLAAALLQKLEAETPIDRFYFTLLMQDILELGDWWRKRGEPFIDYSK